MSESVKKGRSRITSGLATKFFSYYGKYINQFVT